MGLDMYAFSVTPESAISDLELHSNDQLPAVHLAQWRKFYNLHHWMEDLYRRKGGTKSFNCDVVRVDKEDLAELSLFVMDEMNAWVLEGEFDEWTENHIQTTHKFIKDARNEIAKGNVIYYDSWW
jgi:hypothetical protein